MLYRDFSLESSATHRSPVKIYTLEATEILPVSLEESWAFFSNPHNLPKITPPRLNMRITSGADGKIYPGMIIAYSVMPLPPFRTGWVTEITAVDPLRYFVDEQRFGPYKFWHHKHFFADAGQKTEVRDRVHYALPFDPFGRLAHPLFVRRQLDAIFKYRSAQLRSLFGG